MNIANIYQGAFLWIAVIIATVFIQWLIASGRKAKQNGAIPGKPPTDLSHHDFVFRAWRTHQNSVENLSTMLGASFLAILVGVDAGWTTLLIAIMALSRIIHMVLYYAIATEQNPSPRSYFFMLGWIANLALLVLAFITLLS
ncbi:MAG: MAPEG family protein [Idiomarina sp.]